MVAQPVSEKLDDSMDTFWGTRDNLESQARQHYLLRNRYISEQNGRMPYPSVYGTYAISKKLLLIKHYGYSLLFINTICYLEAPTKAILQPSLFGNVLTSRPSGGLHGRTDWAAKYLK